MSGAGVSQALGAPPQQRGGALLRVPEGQWFDRKSVRVSRQALANLLVGFANADGGTIAIGLGSGEVEGTDDDQAHRNELMQAAVDLTEPPVRARNKLVSCVNRDGEPDHLLVVDVEPGEAVHANQRDEVFLRIGDENRKLGYRQRTELTYDKGQASYDGSPVSGADVGDLDRSRLDSYANLLGHPDPVRLLVARGLADQRQRVSVAGYLLFGAHPQDRFPQAVVRVLRYRGSERGVGARQELQHDRRCEGPIPAMLEEAIEEVRQRQPSRRALGPQARFQPRPLIPEDAWIEGIVNAVVHRSYSLGGDHIRAEVFDDRIEIESPGRFPGLVDPRDPRHLTRFARNPRIARTSADLGFGQELGEGIRRMFEEMRRAGLADPGYMQTSASVRLTLSAVPVDREAEARLPSRSRELLEILREAGELGTGEIADALGMGRPAVIRRLKALEEANLVEWVGKSPKDPRAFWKIKW